MAVTLHLHVSDGRIVAQLDGRTLAETPLADLPPVEAFRARRDYRPDPYTLGQPLFRALGGQALLERLEADPDGLLLLDMDEAADALPWEFAALPDRKALLCLDYGFLRLVDRPAPPPPSGEVLYLVALAADPLVDAQGNPRREGRLDFDRELGEVREVVDKSGKAVVARRIPPTKAHLQQALRRGPLWLHLSAHGDLIQTDRGPEAVLLLEDEDGRAEKLLGADLVRLAPRGVLRLAVLSACRTAEGVSEARLARALVLRGVPAAVGMQGRFPDPGSAPFAATLYDSLLAGLDLAEALRQTRNNLLLKFGDWAVGLPVGYMAREGWKLPPPPEGRPDTTTLLQPGVLNLPPEVQAPDKFEGRLRELHEIARAYTRGAKVVTLIGAGGIGKTTLAAAFAQRFAWRWPRGVFGLSLASVETLDTDAFRAELLRGLLGEQAAARLSEAPPAAQEKALLEALQDWDGLLLVDNYETVLQVLADANDPAHAEAEAIHRLLYRVADNTRAHLLLTSREHPAGLPGEVTYPRGQALPGLPEPEAAALFLHHSARAEPDNPAHRRLALAVAQATEGHPLAIILLAGEFDNSREVAPEDFLANWPAELAAARRPGLAPHHVTFAVAFERSYRRLPPELQARLRLLGVFPFPFLPEAAAFAWGLAGEDGAPDGEAARRDLEDLRRRSLLEVDAFFEGTDRAATYRFLPAVREEVARRAAREERAQQQAAYAAYGAWLIDLGYHQFGYNPGLARLVRLSLDALDAGFAAQTGLERLRKSWKLAWLKRTFGRVEEARELLQDLMPAQPPEPARAPEEADAWAHIVYEMAYIYRLRGDLDQAMRFYQESLRIQEALGDQQGKSATLHAMAYIYRLRGDLDQAMRLYQQALTILEALGDQKGKSATLHEIAYIYTIRGDLDQAMCLYQQALAILEALGDQKGKSATLHQMAYIYTIRGDLDQAMPLYQQALVILETLGDQKGKSATLHQMAYIYTIRGDLDQAMPLYQESLRIKEALGDQQGKSATLHQMAYIYTIRGDLDQAMRLYQQALAIDEALGDQQGRAITLGMMGQALFAADRHAEGIHSLMQGYLILERLNIEPQTRQAMARALADVRHQAGPEVFDPIWAEVTDGAPLPSWLAQAPPAVEVQGSAPQEPGEQSQPGLTIPLEALPDDLRRALEAAVAKAQAEGRDLTADDLPPEVHRALESLAQALARAAANPQQALVDQVKAAVRAVQAGQVDKAALLSQLEPLLEQVEEGEEPGSPWWEVGQFLRAVIARLKGEPPPPVPQRYADDWAEMI